MERYKVSLEFTEPVLGTAPKNKKIFARWVQDKADGLSSEQRKEELETVIENLEMKGSTGFHMLDGLPILYDYVIKGFCKDACGMLRRAPGTRSSKVTAYRKVIDGLVFVEPRRIPLIVPDDQEMGILERPLRAQTAQGERVALARSDTCPVGTKMEFIVTVLGSVPTTLLKEWFDYGQLRGLGQWRNASYGRFTYTMEKVEV